MPVQEKDTTASAKAIKKIPIKPPRSAWASTLVLHELGKVSSKAPKKEAAKKMSTTKKTPLKIVLLANSLSESDPKIVVTIVPNNT